MGGGGGGGGEGGRVSGIFSKNPNLINPDKFGWMHGRMHIHQTKI